MLRVTFKPFNFVADLVRIVTRLLLQSNRVSTTKSKPRPPRRPTLAVIVGTIPADVFAVVRMSWFRKGQPFEVEEFQILECPDATAIFQGTVGQALQLGADVSVVTTYSAETLGIPQP